MIFSNEDLINLFYKKTIQYNPKIFVEIGAYEASASKFISKNCPDIRCFCFEANIHNYNKFQKEFEKNNSLNYYNYAVSNYDGDTTFFLQKQKNKNKFKKTKKNNSLSKRTEQGVIYEELSVNCITMNNFFRNDFESTFALWIDAEGKGLEVLQGCTDILPRTVSIFIEVEKKSFWQSQYLDNDIIDWLSKRGFKVIGKDNQTQYQYNILFLNENYAYR